MKKLIISIIAIILLIGGTVNAQKSTRKTPEENAKMQADKIKIALALTEEQNTKVYEIYLTAAKKMDSLKTANPDSKGKALRALMKPITNTRDEKMKAVFTKEQAETYIAKKAELQGSKKGSKKTQ